MRLRFLTAAALCACCVFARAEPPAQNPDRPAIPFRAEPSPVESHGSRLGLAALVLLLGAGGALYLGRARLAARVARWRNRAGQPSTQLELVDSLRVNPRTTVYVLRLGNERLIFAQSGEHIAPLVATPLPTLADTTLNSAALQHEPR